MISFTNQPTNKYGLKPILTKYFLPLVMLFLFVTSCEQEEIFESQQVEQITERKFKIKQYTFKEIESKPIIKETFQIFDKTVSTNIKSKSVMEKMYKFTIDSSRINEIQAENYTSYTIRINREYDTTGYFENLVIEKDSLNSINAYIIKYTPNTDIQINTEHNSYNFEGERSIKKIIYDASKVAYKIINNCYEVVEMWCSWQYDHIAQNSCFEGNHLFIKLVEECPEGSGGDDNSKAGGTSSTSGNDESNPIVTVPIGDDMVGDGPEYIINNLTGRAKCVYDKLEETNDNLFKTTIGAFIDDPDYNLILEIGDCLTSDNACTKGINIGATGKVTIIIEDNYQSPLEMAATILHEGIHAEIYRYVDMHNKHLTGEDRPLLLDYYLLSKGLDNVDAQHQYMADKFVKPIAEAIRALDNSKYTLDYYMAFGWDGLARFAWNGYYNGQNWEKLKEDSEYPNYAEKQKTVLTNTAFNNDVCN